MGGAIKLFQDRKANPPPPRDPRLPAKPKGQTVGSFRQGLKMLPEAIERNIKDSIRWGAQAGRQECDGMCCAGAALQHHGSRVAAEQCTCQIVWLLLTSYRRCEWPTKYDMVKADDACMHIVRCCIHGVPQARSCTPAAADACTTRPHASPAAGHRVNWKLQNIAKTESGDYQLTYDTPEGTKQIMTRQVALTIPAYTAADLLQKQCVSGSL